jgi:UDP-N-acetylmuramoylalanine--D-glutamate ligase
MTKPWQGKQIVIVGAARQGLALARYLAKRGAKVTLNDRRTADQLKDEQQNLSNFDIEWSLGDHPISLLDHADLLCISGGVPLTNPLVVEALKRGMPLSNDTQIFMEAVPCQTIGITGSAGKTTTTTLTGRIAQSSGARYRRVWIGGNIGDPLIHYLDEMDARDLAIIEISSFQLEQMTISPKIAAIINITPNHLDRHGTMEAYTAAKARLIDFQSQDDVTILCRDDAGSYTLRDRVKGKLITFGFEPLPADQAGVFERNGNYVMRDQGKEIDLINEDAIDLRGDHNKRNVMAACAITFAAGYESNDMRAGVEGFNGVAHRLEFVRHWRGANWYNDSIATAPERAMAAIKSFGGPLIILLGGRDKNLPWDDLAKLIKERVDHVIIFGEAAGKIQSSLGARVPGSRPFSVTTCAACQEAVMAASRVAQPGYTVLFSPGGTSYDEFKDFEERGERFKQWVQEFSETLR